MKIYYFLSLLLATASVVSAQTIKIVSDEKTNSLIIKAPPSVQKQIEALVKDLDEENRESLGLKVVQLVYLQTSEITPLLQNVMNAYKPVQIRSSQIGLNNNSWNANIHGVVLGDDRTNKIIILSDKRTTDQLEKIIKDLDKKTNLTDNVMLTKIKNADATLMASLIQNVSGKR